jgi:hypothetical protein
VNNCFSIISWVIIWKKKENAHFFVF